MTWRQDAQMINELFFVVYIFNTHIFDVFFFYDLLNVFVANESRKDGETEVEIIFNRISLLFLFFLYINVLLVISL